MLITWVTFGNLNGNVYYLTAFGRRLSLPSWWWPSKLSLSSGDVKCVTGAFQNFFDFLLIRALVSTKGAVQVAEKELIYV